MTEKERQERREERRRNRKPGISIGFGDYALPEKPADEDAEWFPPYYLQIASTIGLERNYGHPEIEAFISFDMECTGHSVVSYLANTVREGARYAPGDRVCIPGHYAWQKRGTVEFRESRNSYGPCLRAVVLGVEEEFQSLSTEEAYAYLDAHGPLYDPCQGL